MHIKHQECSLYDEIAMHYYCIAFVKCDGLVYSVLINVMLCIPSLTTRVHFSVYWLQ